MKRNNLFRWIIALLLVCFLGACKNDELAEPTYKIDLNGTPDVYATLNANDKLEIPIRITCEKELKNAYYKLVVTKANGELSPGTAINIPVKGYSLDTVITVPVTLNLHSVVFAVYDQDDKINIRTIRIESVKELPVVSFKDGVNLRKTVCVGIPFAISGKVESKYDLKAVSLTPVVAGAASTPVTIDLTNKTSLDYVGTIPVAAGLEYVVLKAENMYGGVVVDTFKILNVVSTDFVDIALDNEATELNRILKGESNTVGGLIVSGSDIATLKFAVKVNGAMGALQDAVLIDNAGNEAKFTFSVNGEQGLEAVQLIATNKGGKSATVNYTVPALRTRVAYLANVQMSTDPVDNTNFLALYEATPVFGDAVAKGKQGRIDFYLANKGNGVQPLSPHAYGAGTAYYDACKSSFAGFTELTYMFLSAVRGKLIKAEFDNILTENELRELINYRIIGPNPDGENYNVVTASRRVGDTFNTSTKKDGGYVIGWGSHTHPNVSPAVVQNNSFAIVWVKSVTLKSNGHYVMVFDIKYPVADQRAANNTSSIAPYSPYPL